MVEKKLKGKNAEIQLKLMEREGQIDLSFRKIVNNQLKEEEKLIPNFEFLAPNEKLVDWDAQINAMGTILTIALYAEDVEGTASSVIERSLYLR